MKRLGVLLLLVLLLPTLVMAQNPDVQFKMGYFTIKLAPTKKHFLSNFTMPGKEALCGFYSKYNNTFYPSKGGKIKVDKEEYITAAEEICADTIFFNDGPKPYAMMELPVQISEIDYDFNILKGTTDGAYVEIETFNKDIDAFYNKYYKNRNQFGPLRVNLVMKNWNYDGESAESFAMLKENAKPKKKYRGKRSKYEEKYIHSSEYMR